VGRAAAVALFNRFPGRWEVAQLEANTAAQAFWRRVIGDYTGGDYTERWVDDDEHRGPAQTFRSGPPNGPH
jgi:predicted acetyltransferase